MSKNLRPPENGFRMPIGGDGRPEIGATVFPSKQQYGSAAQRTATGRLTRNTENTPESDPGTSEYCWPPPMFNELYGEAKN